ncbi:kinase-like domain-containing protein [Rhizophagus irregularis DAOM 181602=DAOM 197198]|nr:kinase-like domain-containing protein [Rhizophagus irregularis DAOM 181602=DAOM 197198]
MFNLAIFCENGKGTEKNLEKAFYWCQKAMHNLALYYENNKGTEKNLEKAFYWYQKAAEQGDIVAMYNLAICYKNGDGTDKNLEKAFHLYQKAAEKGYIDAVFNLANKYKDGEGTEKNLEKAFYWYQKAAEKGDISAMFNLAMIFYESGKETEKNFEKAFHWNGKEFRKSFLLYQKAAENDDEIALFNLAICYENGEGTEKNLEKAFHCYQKAAEKDHIKAMFYLAVCYENGEGTEKNLEKAFYWYQKAAENGNKEAMLSLANKYENENGTEKNLEKAFYWHQKIAWTSKNEFIKKFIQEAQLSAKNIYEILEWIPYNKLSSVNYYDKGGFSEIHKAIWSDGPIFGWNSDKQQWNRQTNYNVILKILNNSSSLDSKFLDEWKYHYNCQKKSFSKFIQFFGFTQDPNNLNYIIVMSYAKKGSLRKCLSDIIKFKWQDKLQLLKEIILGLKVIHESNLTHGDFHDGNILISDNHNEIFIIDLGLCKPISDFQDSDNNEIYGVLPYMDPEILRNKPYTPASDIYSFSMVMWEFTSGIPPFNREAHDRDLILNICEGKRPVIVKNTPKCYIDLMKKCWDSNPSNRPTMIMLEHIISEWIRCVDKYYEINSDGNYQYI